MVESKLFKKFLVGSTALIGASFLAPTTALAVSCPANITGAALASVTCDFDNTTGSSVTVENGGSVGAVNMTNYTTPSTILNNGTISNPAAAAAITISGSVLSNGIVNNGSIAAASATGIHIYNTSTISGGITNTGSISASGLTIAIDHSQINNGITNSGHIVSSVLGTGLSIANSSTVTGGIANSGTISGSGDDEGIAIVSSTLDGGIHNTGTIESTGDGNGLFIRESNTTGGIANSGTISGGQSGLVVFNVSSVTGDIDNSGTITGSTSNGVAVHNGTTLTGSIINRSGGTISGGMVGIAVYSWTTISGGIQNYGTVIGGNTGIKLSSTSTVVGGIQNSGTITGGSYGVYMDANSTSLVNNGTINLTSPSGHALHSIGNGNTVINNGTVNFISGAVGISSNGNNNTLTNNGSMEVRFGIASNGNANILTNNGTILSHGVLGGGLSEATAGTSQLYNHGTIIGTGDTSFGLKGVGGNLLYNSGTIRTTGTGILGVGDSIAAVNRGVIENADGIRLTGDNNTVTLGMNSATKGTITFTGASNTLLYDLANVPRTGGVIYVGDTITGADTVTIANTANLPARAQMVRDSRSIAVLTPEQFSSTQQVIGQTLVDAGTVLNNRQQLALLGDTTETAGGRQYAASTALLSDASDPNGWAVRDRKLAWTEGFGSYQERGSDGSTLDSKAQAGGILTGIDLPQSDLGYRSGLYVGGFTGKLDIGTPTFHTIDSTGGLAGGYIGKSFGGYYVSTQLDFGFSDNESDRFTGVDTANAEYNSYFVSPSFTVMHPILGNGITWVPSAIVRYTAQFDDSYTENSSVVNQSMDPQTSSLLNGRLLLEARFDPEAMQQGTLKTSMRVGIQGQTLLGSRKVNVQVLGTDMSFDPSGGDNYVDGVVGGNLVRSLDDGLDLYGDAEADLGLNKGGAGSNKGIVGRIGARWKL